MAGKIKLTCSQCGKDVFGFKEAGGITVKYKGRVLRIEREAVTFVCRFCCDMTVVSRTAEERGRLTCPQCGKDIFGFREAGEITIKYKDRMLRIGPKAVIFTCRACGAMTVVSLKEDSLEGK